jgi:threonine dehydrogenase-like Zn-dependent dehydrogenase
MKSAPAHAHVIVVGVCPHEEKITPLEGITRELTLEFSFAYRTEEFATALHPDRSPRRSGRPAHHEPPAAGQHGGCLQRARQRSS